MPAANHGHRRAPAVASGGPPIHQLVWPSAAGALLSFDSRLLEQHDMPSRGQDAHTHEPRCDSIHADRSHAGLWCCRRVRSVGERPRCQAWGRAHRVSLGQRLCGPRPQPSLRRRTPRLRYEARRWRCACMPASAAPEFICRIATMVVTEGDPEHVASVAQHRQWKMPVIA